ncbi:SagB family peptide dehydrogenase [Antrihabitans stalagmiti]|uniref:SagB family peptide dehydrogenase n=1 Tax=Antrihabitans stalagmiti TaxID=2799499 RepID=UPI0027DD1CB5|nr:SagB family peptide dehydrogenase [Antrihabitans stalagmiti]
MNRSVATRHQDVYSFRPGATCVTTPRAAILLAPPHKEKLPGVTPAQLQALKTLNLGPATLDDLSPTGADADVDTLVGSLAERGWLAITVRFDGTDLYTIRPFATPPARPEFVEEERTLSKFTIMRRDKNNIVAENPLSWCDIDIHDPRVLEVVSGLASPAEPALPDDVSARLAADLKWARHTVVDAESEDDEFATRSWNAHELWFHRRSNLSERILTWETFGPTRWADGEFPPLPARKDNYPGDAIALATPDIEDLRAVDPSLTDVLEDRVSCRDFDDAAPITLDRLGELLFRTVRTKSLRTAKGVEYLSRPYPSGGAVHELEFYPVVRNVAGLASGMYHYDSFDHVLRPVADDQVVERLLRTSSLTLSQGQLPQVLIVIAARSGRLMWTYEQVPYAIILKHVGVVLQTIYLVATAMGLGAVAQGYGDTTAFNDAAGVDELEECNVGSIVIGAPKR